MAPVLILALLGMAELGNALNSYLTIVNTARDAARLYSQGDATDASIEAMVQRETGRLADAVDIDGLDHCATQELGVCLQAVDDGDDGVEYDHVSVRVCYDHPVIIGVPLLLPGPIRMCSTTVMRMAE
jgi:Flp pilus assembly protein TadG